MFKTLARALARHWRHIVARIPALWGVSVVGGGIAGLLYCWDGEILAFSVAISSLAMLWITPFCLATWAKRIKLARGLFWVPFLLTFVWGGSAWCYEQTHSVEGAGLPEIFACIAAGSTVSAYLSLRVRWLGRPFTDDRPAQPKAPAAESAKIAEQKRA